MQTKYKLNHSLFIFVLTILFFIAAFPLAQAQTAAPGDLDTTFGSGGKVVTPITPLHDSPGRARIQPDGKIVTVGIATDNSFGCPANSFLVRHNADGTVDNSFGTNGSVIVTFDNGDIEFYDFVILPNGKFLVTANKPTTSCGNAGDLVIYRYTANGTLDVAFGTNGVITTSFSSGSVSGGRIVLQPDGKFVVAGHAGSGAVAVVRYNPNGTLDTTFGTIGITTTSVENSIDPGVSEILVQTDGKLLVAGSARFGSNGNIFVLRYNSNGTLDNSFGANGIVRITELPSQSYRLGIARALAIQQNGKILTAGERNGTFAISRYNSNGTIDTSFGTNGVVITPIGNINGGISSIALQTDGKIIAVGSAYVNGFFDVGLVRYLGDSLNAPRTRFDFDGDGRLDISVFRPSDGVWYLNRSGSGFTAAQFGISTDKIVPADYDGDGKTDIVVYRDGIWYLLRSAAVFTAVQFGIAEDIPQPADFDGDGKAELAVYRPSNGVWYVFNLVNNNFSGVQFGLPTDKAVVGDYDGDSRADYAVYRPSSGVWYLLQSTAGFTATQFGIAEDKPVVGDYDGDGKADIAVYRPSSGIWYLLRSTQGFTALQFGIATDLPTPGDYDGDGKTDIAVYRDGNWYLQNSTTGFTSVQFGLPIDKPIPNAYVP